MNKDKKYLENKISNTFSDLEQMQSKIFHHMIHEGNFIDLPHPPEWWLEEESQLELSHRYLIESLHNQIICYLDMIGLKLYVDIFIKKFGELPDIKNAYNGIDYDPEHNGIYNTYLHDLWSFLTPFEFFKNELGNKMHGIKYLETILKNTASIIHNSETDPKSEAQVYNTVKIVIQSIFPSSIDGGSNFLKTAKEYKPDILIPEIGVAVEYKYAQNENKLKATIEQIAADVIGYTGDSDYNAFYAVFYVTNDFWGREKFDQVWKENKFPKNWKGYYIVGSRN